MAVNDKNIVITPNIGSTTADPKIVFSGADASTAAQNITLQVYPTNSGTVSFEGSSGQLFSITNSLTGTIYSVNDVSGIPSIEVLDTGLVKLAQYSGNVLIGTGTDNVTDRLQVNGSIRGTALTSTVATGTAPLTVASTTLVTNLNADMVEGLHVHTGTNNEVNKIVRTDVNGYIQAGWINTTSGDNGTTTISRVYASGDGYIRYYSPANFKTVLGLVDYKNYSAQFSLHGGGTVTFGSGANVLWSARVIAIPAENNELSSSGYIDINCPTSGTVTYYNSSNVTTTVTCTAAGIPLGAWEALYYQITEGQASTSDQTKFRVVTYQNTTWSPGPGWLLLAARNGDDNSLKWIPGQINIPSGGNYNSSTGAASWVDTGTTLTNKILTSYKETVNAVGTVSTTTYSINLTTANIVSITLGANVTFTFTNAPASGTFMSCTVILRQDATGNRTATFTGAKYTDGVAPVLSTAANRYDILSFFTIDGGTSWFGSYVGANIT